MEIGKQYEIKMVYKVDTSGSFRIRFADFEQNGVYTDPETNRGVDSGFLSNTGGV